MTRPRTQVDSKHGTAAKKKGTFVEHHDKRIWGGGAWVIEIVVYA